MCSLSSIGSVPDEDIFSLKGETVHGSSKLVILQPKHQADTDYTQDEAWSNTDENLEILKKEIKEAMKMDKQMAEYQQRVQAKMLKTLGGGSGIYLQILQNLFDYWFCGSHEQRFETFYGMV